jgi:3-oxoisoapionate decarboxylase
MRPEVVEAIPWADRDLDWLASSLGFLRSVVPALAGI